jgi:hypothetical protein
MSKLPHVSKTKAIWFFNEEDVPITLQETIHEDGFVEVFRAEMWKAHALL